MNNTVMGLHKGLPGFLLKGKKAINLVNTNLSGKVVATLLTLEGDGRYRGTTKVEGIVMDLPLIQVDGDYVKETMDLGGVTLTTLTETANWGPEYLKQIEQRIRVIKLDQFKEYTPLTKQDIITLDYYGTIARNFRDRIVKLEKVEDKTLNIRNGYVIRVTTTPKTTGEPRVIYWVLHPTLGVSKGILGPNGLDIRCRGGLKAIVN